MSPTPEEETSLRDASSTAPQRPTEAVSLDEVTARHRGALRRYFNSHPRVMDLVVSVVYVLLTFSVLSVRTQPWTWALVIAVGVVLYFRRRWPLTVLVTVLALELVVALPDVWRSGLGLGALFGLYAVGVTYRRRIVVITTILTPLPLVIIFFVSAPGNLAAELSDISVSMFRYVVAITTYLGAVIAAGIGVSVRQRRQYEAAISGWAQKAAASGREAERAVIAREMHDVVAHSLTVMVALADGAAVVVGKDPERAREVIGQISRTGRDALADTRRVLGVLRDENEEAPRGPLNSSDDLERMIGGFFTAGLPLKYSFSGPPLPVDTALRLAFFRIVQESLTNILRHSRGVTHVDVKVDHIPQRILIRVENDGVPTEPDSEKRDLLGGHGVSGMRARAALYSGTVTAGPRPQGGWLVRAVLNYDASNEQTGEAT